MHFGVPLDDDRLAALLRPDERIRTVITADAYGAGEADRAARPRAARASTATPTRSSARSATTSTKASARGRRASRASPTRACAARTPTRDYLRMAAERSLERIGADRFDLLLLHNPDRTGYTSEAVWAGMERCATLGLTDALGVAPGPANGFTLDVIDCFERFGDADRLGDADPQPARAVARRARARRRRAPRRRASSRASSTTAGSSTTTWPRATSSSSATTARSAPAGWVERGREKLEAMRPIAERHELTMLQLACQWNLAHRPVRCVAPTLIEEPARAKPIEAKRNELAGVPEEVVLSDEDVAEIRRIGDNTGSMTLKGASPDFEGEPRADAWPLERRPRGRRRALAHRPLAAARPRRLIHFAAVDRLRRFLFSGSGWPYLLVPFIPIAVALELGARRGDADLRRRRARRDPHRRAHGPLDRGAGDAHGPRHRRLPERHVRQLPRAGDRVLRAERRPAGGRQGVDHRLDPREHPARHGRRDVHRRPQARAPVLRPHRRERAGADAAAGRRGARAAGDLRAHRRRARCRASARRRSTTATRSSRCRSSSRSSCSGRTRPGCCSASRRTARCSTPSTRRRTTSARRGRSSARSSRWPSPASLVGIMSEVLVGSIIEASEGIGISEFFVGLIVVAIVGNAAEHWVAIYFAAKDKMDLAVNIAIGSSAQIALFVAPLLVLLSFVPGHRRPPDGAGLQRLRAGGRAARDPRANFVVNEGESTWFEGLAAASPIRPHGRRLLLRVMGLPAGAALVAALLLFLWLDLHFFARGREPSFREGVVWSIALARRQPARRGRAARVRGLRDGDRVHDRLLHRALALARQPLRLPPALRVLRHARRAAGAAALLRASSSRSCCAAWPSSAASR